MIRVHVAPAAGEAFERRAEGDQMVIGRSPQCDLQLADAHLSRRHARLFRRGDLLLVEDLGSHSGTFLNSRRITSPETVRSGDTVRVATTLLTIEPEGRAPAPRPTPAVLGTEMFLSAAEILSAAAPPREASDQALARYSERLEMINDVHRAVSRSISLAEVLELILDRIFDHLKPEAGAIVLRGENGEFHRAATRTSAGFKDEDLYSRTLLHEVAEKGMAAIVQDASQDARFATAESFIASGVRSLVAAPLADGEGSLGMIALVSRAHRRLFSNDDLELLVSLAAVAALRIRNVELAEQAADRRRMKEELDLARQIQMALLPARLPEFPGYELYGANLASRGVSGDYYLITERRADDTPEAARECVLMIADVSGKGITAALLAACLEALSAVPIEQGLPPEAVCTSIARLLYARTSAESFATAFLAVLDPESGRLRYANAGHNPALVVRSGREVECLRATGAPLGILPSGAYAGAELVLAPGETLVLYTDGIVEATAPGDEEFGLERLIDAVERHRQLSLKELARALDADLDAFVRGVPYADDRTLVLARRL